MHANPSLEPALMGSRHAKIMEKHTKPWGSKYVNNTYFGPSIYFGLFRSPGKVESTGSTGYIILGILGEASTFGPNP